MRWIWIDRFTVFESRKTATAVKCLSLAEDHFAEHFPGFPVMPAPLILEGLAQTGGILVGEANNFQEKVVLAKIPHAKFHREAMPGETLTYTADLIDLRPEGAVVKGRVTSDGDPIRATGEAPLISCELICEAEIFFAHLDKSRSQQLFGDHNFVFDGELKYLLGAAKAAALPAG